MFKGIWGQDMIIPRPWRNPGRDRPLGLEWCMGLMGHLATLGEPWARGQAMLFLCPGAGRIGRGVRSQGQGLHVLRGQDFVFFLADFNNFIF